MSNDYIETGKLTYFNQSRIDEDMKNLCKNFFDEKLIKIWEEKYVNSDLPEAVRDCEFIFQIIVSLVSYIGSCTNMDPGHAISGIFLSYDCLLNDLTMHLKERDRNKINMLYGMVDHFYNTSKKTIDKVIKQDQ